MRNSEKRNYNLHEHLKTFFGFDNFKQNQEVAIKNLLEGNDGFVIMPTGGGKSLCYQLPALILGGTAIIVSPLIALMKNQVDSIRNHSNKRNIANFLNSTLTKGELEIVKENLINGTTKLLYVAPESLNKEENIELLKSIEVSFFAIDEAHCISEWGHDFRPEYRRLRSIIDAIGDNIPIIALTATATPKVQLDIQKNLGMMDAAVYKSSFNRPNLYYEVRPKNNNTLKEIIKFINGRTSRSGIIYCLSRKKVEELAENLQVNGINARPYHAGLDSHTRANNQDSFLMEETDVIVATIAFGMGIDKPDVRFVIHYDIPKSLEGYYQETGRAGRDGGEGICLAFYSYNDIQKLEKFMKGKPVAEQEISKLLLLETITYAESSICRRKQLLYYFGETYEPKDCHNCDNCLKPKKLFEAKEYLVTLLKVVIETKEQFKAGLLANILSGTEDTEVTSLKLDKLKAFGIGKEYDKKFWLGIVRNALIQQFIKKDIDNYAILKMTKAGDEFIEKPYSIMIAKDHDYSDSDNKDSFDEVQKTSTTDETLFALLKDLRKYISKKESLPPYVIFQDPSLEDMSIQYPISMEELGQISGVGTGKAKKYGQPFIELISKYVDENEIDRPQDLVVKSPVNKSGMKVYIIQSIDRKLPLEDIALTKNLSYEDLLTEIEHIVASGTKINIDYYIDERMEVEIQDEIYDFFYDSESGSIEDACNELGPLGYSENDIRIIRLKFISEVGN